MDENTFSKVIINPFYAINFSEQLFGEHQPLVTKEVWVNANKRLIEEVGIQEWLIRLLDVLENGGTSSDDVQFDSEEAA